MGSEIYENVYTFPHGNILIWVYLFLAYNNLQIKLMFVIYAIERQ